MSGQIPVGRFNLLAGPAASWIAPLYRSDAIRASSPSDADPESFPKDAFPRADHATARVGLDGTPETASLSRRAARFGAPDTNDGAAMLAGKYRVTDESGNVIEIPDRDLEALIRKEKEKREGDEENRIHLPRARELQERMQELRGALCHPDHLPDDVRKRSPREALDEALELMEQLAQEELHPFWMYHLANEVGYSGTERAPRNWEALSPSLKRSYADKPSHLFRGLMFQTRGFIGHVVYAVYQSGPDRGLVTRFNAAMGALTARLRQLGILPEGSKIIFEIQHYTTAGKDSRQVPWVYEAACAGVDFGLFDIDPQVYAPLPPPIDA